MQGDTTGGHPPLCVAAETGASDYGGQITVDSGQWRKTGQQFMRGNFQLSPNVCQTQHKCIALFTICA